MRRERRIKYANEGGKNSLDEIDLENEKQNQGQDGGMEGSRAAFPS